MGESRKTADTAESPKSRYADEITPSGQPKHPSASPRRPHDAVQSVQPYPLDEPGGHAGHMPKPPGVHPTPLDAIGGQPGVSLTPGFRTPKIATGQRVVMGAASLESRAGTVKSMTYDGDTEYYHVEFEDGGPPEYRVPAPLLSRCPDDASYEAVRSAAADRIARMGANEGLSEGPASQG